MDDSQKSPHLSRMNHTIPHKWHRSTRIRLLSDQICMVCQRRLGLGFFSSWEKCKSCKCKVHSQCKSRIGDTCGLTSDHLRHWVEGIITQHNTSLWSDLPAQETVFPISRWTMGTVRGGNPQAGWKEVTISLADIEFRKNPNPLLGYGRFGHVVRGYYFGDVAVKFLNMNHVEESRRLDEFKAEVAAHKNARHDNINLFLGCCMEEGRFGIVMSLCKGQSLHHLLHETKEKVELSTAHHIATQICQGISYLHTKKILHKDLRSKNVYVENKHKVVITDFNISSMKRLRHPSRKYSIQIPQHWLVYQSPEIIQSIALDGRELPFSEKSDAFSFGTLWFELLTYGFPFAREHPDKIMYLVGHGIKPSLHNIKTNKEARPKIVEILMRCWNFSSRDRPSFAEIINMLNSLPRRGLDRSPSSPMIRSFESSF